METGNTASHCAWCGKIFYNMTPVLMQSENLRELDGGSQKKTQEKKWSNLKYEIYLISSY